MTRRSSDQQTALAEGRREFPKDLIAAELVRDEILGTITREGRAILSGKREFPQNPAAAKLVQGEILGTLIEFEREQLAYLRAKKKLAA